MPAPTASTALTVPPVVTLDLWGVALPRLPAALLRMATDRRRLRGLPGLRFGKLLGTGSGRTFGPGDADPRHWAVLAVWDTAEQAQAFGSSPVVAGWDHLADERWSARMRPVASRGLWSRRHPFGPDGLAGPPPAAGAPVAALTRARLAPRRAATFWRAVPPVSGALHRSPGLRLAVGVGEAPVGLQGTFSVWESAAALRAFAYRDPAHVQAVEDTARLGWYAEELFARFEVLEATGTYRGTDPLAAA